MVQAQEAAKEAHPLDRAEAPPHGWRRFATNHRLFVLVLFLAMAGLQYRTLFLGSLINADPTQQVWLHMDEATVNYDAARIASGQVMYRDFFQFQGPVHYYTYAALFSVTGRSFRAARVLTVATVALSACVLALLVLRLLGHGRSGYVAACAAAVTHAAGFVPTWTCTYPHWTAELLVLSSLLLATHPRAGPWTHRAAGVLVGAGFWTILSLGLPAAITLLVVTAFLGRGSESRRVLDHPAFGVLTGIAACTVLVLAYFAMEGALSQMIYAVFVWPFSAYGEGQADAAGYASYFQRTVSNHAALGFPWSVFGRVLGEATRRLPQLAFLGVLPALFIGARLVLSRRVCTLPQRSFLLIATVAAACTSPLVLGVSRADMTHLAFVGSWGLLGFAALASLLHARRRLVLGLFAASASMILVNHVSMHRHTSADLRSWEAYIEADPTSQKLLPHLKPGDLLFDTEYFSGLRYFYLNDAASPVTFIPHSGGPGYYTPAQWTWIAQEIERNRPAVINTDVTTMALLNQHAPGIVDHYVRNAQGVYLSKPR